jgi:hypothetical protein
MVLKYSFVLRLLCGMKIYFMKRIGPANAANITKKGKIIGKQQIEQFFNC